ncbi:MULTISPECIES: zf-HC2 domain-containing protein [Streptomyces]|uniref:Zf-HC2 domain-containing protein n=1 Tax=Streptomyces solicathayae TaxID=3081768 RepID=A0ABZ0LXA2_9ACTN|nr:zf-HC2 domain-containing protein [Streptomyces sp. HUAS YS2]WOX24093.1 zf-HC2 domain-containing protein [Streptomyces sp. HUAS YS2]
MTAYDSDPAHDRESPHDAVGAYVLGVLDDADATAFEAHLAGCARCAAHLDEFAGLTPMLAMLAEGPGPAAVPEPRTGDPGAGAGIDPYADDAFDAFAPRPPAPRPAPPGPAVVEPPVTPRPELLDRLVDEVAAKRAQRRRRTMYLVAAAAALIIGGPAVAVVATSGDGDGRNNVAADPHPTSPAEDAFFHHMEEKIAATDATTKVSATVGMEKKGWGTHTVLELKNVKGPLKCTLVAVSKTGEEEIVTSWAVPKWGYGIPDSPNEAAKNPLYVHGGAAMNRDEIDRFEVRTFDGDRLVEVGA